MNFLIGIIVIILSIICAYLMTFKHLDRKNFFNDLYIFTSKLKSDILYSQNTIDIILNNSVDRNSDFYYLYSKYLTDNILDFDKLKYLTKDETSFIKNIITNIGKSDSLSSIDFLNEINKKCLELNNQSFDNYKKYKLLYIKMGFLIGIFLFVLIM